MSIGDWDEGTLARFIEDVLARDQLPASLRAQGLMGLRVVRGVVDLSGNVIAGAGFSVVRNALGDYTVTWAPAFSARPVSVFTVGTTAGAITIKKSGATVPTGGIVRVVSFVTTTGASADTEFDFMAIGPA